MVKKNSNIHISHSNWTILLREAYICKVKPYFVPFGLVSCGCYWQHWVINHSTQLHSQGPLWLIGPQLQDGLSDDLFSRQVERFPVLPSQVPRMDGSLLYPDSPGGSPSLRPIDSWGRIYMTSFRVTKWEMKKVQTNQFLPRYSARILVRAGEYRERKILDMCRKLKKLTSSCILHDVYCIPSS